MGHVTRLSVDVVVASAVAVVDDDVAAVAVFLIRCWTRVKMNIAGEKEL